MKIKKIQEVILSKGGISIVVLVALILVAGMGISLNSTLKENNAVVKASAAPKSLAEYLSVSASEFCPENAGAFNYRVTAQVSNAAKLQYRCDQNAAYDPAIVAYDSQTWQAVALREQWKQYEGVMLPSCDVINQFDISTILVDACLKASVEGSDSPYFLVYR